MVCNRRVFNDVTCKRASSEVREQYQLLEAWYNFTFISFVQCCHSPSLSLQLRCRHHEQVVRMMSTISILNTWYFWWSHIVCMVVSINHYLFRWRCGQHSRFGNEASGFYIYSIRRTLVGTRPSSIEEIKGGISVVFATFFYSYVINCWNNVALHTYQQGNVT